MSTTEPNPGPSGERWARVYELVRHLAHGGTPPDHASLVELLQFVVDHASLVELLQFVEDHPEAGLKS